MKASYKFSLIIAIIACILIIVYYATRGNSSKKETITNANNGQVDSSLAYTNTPKINDYNTSLDKNSSHKTFAQRLREQLGSGNDNSLNNSLNSSDDLPNSNTINNKGNSQTGNATTSVPANPQGTTTKDNTKSTTNLTSVDSFGNDSFDNPAQTAHNDSTNKTSNTSPKKSETKTANHPEIHVVKDGETLAAIARQAYGSSKYWVNIAKANPGINPDVLHVGQKIKMPDLNNTSHSSKNSKQSNSSQNSNQTSATDQTTYVVQSGDTLSSIAEKVYGNKHKWSQIYRANRGTIGPDPSYLQAGQKLDIPR